jgi:hypothetical protein
VKHFTENIPAESEIADSPALSEVTLTSLSGIVLKDVTTPVTDLKSWALELVLDKTDIMNTIRKAVFIFMAKSILAKDRKKKVDNLWPA